MNNWQSSLKQIPICLSSEQQAWVSYVGSMTEKMRRVCHEVQIQVFSQDMQSLLPSEADYFVKHGKAANSDILAREIVMICDQQAWLYARTVLPYETIEVLPQLQTLGSKALGSLLFSDSAIERQAFEYASLNQTADTITAANKNMKLEQSQYIARRSLFVKQKQALQLTEVFLPAMLHAVAQIDEYKRIKHK